MRPARDEIVAELVTRTLEATDAADARVSILDTLRTAWRAERAILVRADDHGTALVAAVPPDAPGPDVEPAALAAAVGAEESVVLGEHGVLLAIAVEGRPGERWCVALSRRQPAWSADERRALGDLRPHVELVLEHARLRVETGDAARREAAAAAEHERFLNVISHELRNPLAPILMWTSTLKRLRPNDPDVQRATTAIANAVNLERRLIEQLLDLSRIERGALELPMQNIDLRDLVRAAIDERRGAIGEARLAVDAELPPGPVPVRGDPLRLAQIVGALLDNAVKFTPADGRVRVAVVAAAGRAQLGVSDSGTGLPPDVLDRLFAPFVQGKNARGGLGLGLAIAQRLVGLHGGTLEATNPTEGGAHFALGLPLAPAG